MTAVNVGGTVLVLESASHTTTESRVLAADQPQGSFALISERHDQHGDGHRRLGLRLLGGAGHAIMSGR